MVISGLLVLKRVLGKTKLIKESLQNCHVWNLKLGGVEPVQMCAQTWPWMFTMEIASLCVDFVSQEVIFCISS